jgi:hypothetical protein
MRGVASGAIKKPGLSKEEAREFVEHVPTKNLPERKNPLKTKRKPLSAALKP